MMVKEFVTIVKCDSCEYRMEIIFRLTDREPVSEMIKNKLKYNGWEIYEDSIITCEKCMREIKANLINKYTVKCYGCGKIFTIYFKPNDSRRVIDIVKNKLSANNWFVDSYGAMCQKCST